MTDVPQYSSLAAERLRIFVALLTKWNPAINLVSTVQTALRFWP